MFVMILQLQQFEEKNQIISEFVKHIFQLEAKTEWTVSDPDPSKVLSAIFPFSHSPDLC